MLLCSVYKYIVKRELNQYTIVESHSFNSHQMFVSVTIIKNALFIFLRDNGS